jgi:6-phosphofructokinase 1
VDSLNTDAFGHPELGGLGQHLVDLVMTHLKLKARLDKPGTMQRSSGLCISDVDAQEAHEVGAAAVRHAVAGTTSCMISLVRESDRPYRCATGLVPLEAVANREKILPDDFINEAGNHVTSAFKEYARPLLGRQLPPYVTLAAYRVPKRLRMPS